MQKLEVVKFLSLSHHKAPSNCISYLTHNNVHN